MVTTFAPSRPPIGTEQDRMAAPLICTVQEPHCAIPQPNFVPVRPRTSRNTQRSGVSGSMSICRDTPLTSIVITVAATPTDDDIWSLVRPVAELRDLTKGYVGASPSVSLSGKAEDRNRGIAAANFRSDQVVYPYEARDDRYVLRTASIVGDDPTAGRATEGEPQQHLAGSCVQRQQVTGQFTGENHIARGRGHSGHYRFRGVVAPFLLTCGSVN